MTCSDMAADYVFGKKYLKKREVYLIPNGIKKEDYSTRLTEVEKQNYQKEFGISDNTKVLLHVGRFCYPKNHDFIVDVVKQLEKEKFNFIVLLVGDGKLMKEITNKIKLLQLEDKIKLLGRRFDVAQIMQFSDCVILPSLNEGLPTVVIEAQAAGTKVLVSDQVTKQCDMGLGLVEFLPIDSIDCWVSALEKIRPESIPAEKCMKIIDEKRFTAREAGKYYCSILKKEIQNTYKKDRSFEGNEDIIPNRKSCGWRG
ncbi:MAG: glycosyltransferase, partial [Fusobacterium sp.]|nr:glycosyltransferase [Fusobacterium sp.]